MSSGKFIQDNEIKPNLSTKLLTGQDLKLYLIMRFGTYANAGKLAGLSDVRIHQIAMGYSVPENPDILKRLSQAWEIDLVILVQLFDRLRNNVQVKEENHE